MHLQRAEEKVRERQNATLQEFDVGSYARFAWSQEEGVIVFSDGGTPKVVADVQFVGSYSDNTKAWLWAWDNGSIDEPLSSGFAAADAPDCAVREGTAHRSGRLVRRWSHAGDELLICSYGTTPKETAAQAWEGEEFFVVLRRQEAATVLLDFSALHTARYSAAPPGFVFTELTVAAEDRPWRNRLPLVRHDIRLGSSPPMRSSFVFAGRPFEQEKFETMIRKLNAEGVSSAERERMLLRIRDVAVSRPEEALKALEQTRKERWVDGALAEALSMVIREVELARDLPPGTAPVLWSGGL